MSTTTHDTTIRLEGNWSTSGILEQYRLLREHLQILLPGAPFAPQLDLSGITSIDACGCQLLTTFIAGLQRLGIEPSGAVIPEPLISAMRAMGFHHPLGGMEDYPGSGQ